MDTFAWPKLEIGVYSVEPEFYVSPIDSAGKDTTRAVVSGSLRIGLLPYSMVKIYGDADALLVISSLCLRTPSDQGEYCFDAAYLSQVVADSMMNFDSMTTVELEPITIPSDALPTSFVIALRLVDSRADTVLASENLAHPMSVRRHRCGYGFWTSAKEDPGYGPYIHNDMSLSYSVPDSCHVTLKVYNVLGRLVDWLVDESQPPGEHETSWDTGTAPSGIYFYRVEACDSTFTRKFLVLR